MQQGKPIGHSRNLRKPLKLQKKGHTVLKSTETLLLQLILDAKRKGISPSSDQKIMNVAKKLQNLRQARNNPSIPVESYIPEDCPKSFPTEQGKYGQVKFVFIC